MEGQGTQRGVAPGTAAADEGLTRVDQAEFGQMVDGGAGIPHIELAPVEVQGLAIGTAIAGTAPVVEVGHGETALGPVLDACIEHRVAGRGRSAMDEHHQWRRGFGANGRIEEAMGLAIATGVVDGARAADPVGG